MRDPNKAEYLDYVDLTIEGNEDLSIRPLAGSLCVQTESDRWNLRKPLSEKRPRFHRE